MHTINLEGSALANSSRNGSTSQQDITITPLSTDFQLNTAAAPIEGTITFPVVVVKYPYNYHVYQVLLQFTALSGPIVAWLGQLRQGVQ
jgi:hypothetical protein